MTRRAITASLCLGLGLLVGCGSRTGHPVSAGGEISPLYRRAVATGQSGQARILKDGKVTFDEYVEASRALADCARRRGLPMQPYEDWDMRGRTVFVDPKVIFHGKAGSRATRITESCQEREQLLVDQAWQRLRPAISDEAYDLWRTCLSDAGYHGKIPRSYYLIGRELDPALVDPCERKVYQGLADKRAPRAL